MFSHLHTFNPCCSLSQNAKHVSSPDNLPFLKCQIRPSLRYCAKSSTHSSLPTLHIYHELLIQSLALEIFLPGPMSIF